MKAIVVPLKVFRLERATEWAFVLELVSVTSYHVHETRSLYLLIVFFSKFSTSTLFFLYGSPPGPLVVNSIHLPLNTHLRFNQKNSFPMKYLFRNQDGVSDFKTEQPLIPVVVKSLDQMNSTKQALFRNRGQVYFSVDLNENNLTCLPFSWDFIPEGILVYCHVTYLC